MKIKLAKDALGELCNDMFHTDYGTLVIIKDGKLYQLQMTSNGNVLGEASTKAELLYNFIIESERFENRNL